MKYAELSGPLGQEKEKAGLFLQQLSFTRERKKSVLVVTGDLSLRKIFLRYD